MIALPTHPSHQDHATKDDRNRNGPWELAELCLVETAALLHENRLASEAEIQQAVSRTRESHASGRPQDLLETLARVHGHDEEHIGPAILDLSNRIAASIQPYPPLIPFAGKLIAPSAFYDSFDQIHVTGKALLCPVLFAEDTDAIGVGSINPVAASLLGEQIAASVHRRFGIRPFISIARLDYESWTFLTRKHFEL